VNTFLPFRSYAESAKCLDNKRLFKQLVECKQLWTGIHYQSKGWVNHPATVMWRPYTEQYMAYWRATLLEVVRRGAINPDAITRWRKLIDGIGLPLLKRCPWWMEHPAVFVSHRSNLYKKNPDHYRAFECQYTGYFWPDPEHERYTYLESGEPKSRRTIYLEEANQIMKDIYGIEGVREF
jgi:Pyrimidine dimer DNA glycosylase